MGVRVGSGIYRGPQGDGDDWSLRYGVILEQRLNVLPAGHGADLEFIQWCPEVQLGRHGQVITGSVAKIVRSMCVGLILRRLTTISPCGEIVV